MFDPGQLQALTAVLKTGSFEAAASTLNITQSAVSQRIRTLEDRLGGPVIIRDQPCAATPTGERLLRHAEAVALLEQATLRDLGDAPAAATVRVALNADSLATWVLPALAGVPGLLFDLVIDDQDHSASWLREGRVAAAITSRAEPVQGCDVHALGALDYIATASPAFAERYFKDGLTDEAFQAAPCLTFNAKDTLQSRFIQRETGKRLSVPLHYVASTEGFVTATQLGLGWGLNPAVLVRQSIADGTLVALSPDPVTTPLYWQVSRLVSQPLKALTQAIRAAAHQALVSDVP